MALVADARGAAPTLERHVRLTGDDPADLLVHWLNTVLLESELARAVWTRAEVRRLTPTALEASLLGSPARPGATDLPARDQGRLAARADPGAGRAGVPLPAGAGRLRGERRRYSPFVSRSGRSPEVARPTIW